MFEHKKNLLQEVKVKKPNPQYAVLMQEQLGGANGELKAAMQYISQSFRIKDPVIKDLFLDIGAEELSHIRTLELLKIQNYTLIYQLQDLLMKHQIQHHHLLIILEDHKFIIKLFLYENTGCSYFNIVCIFTFFKIMNY